MTRDQIAEIFVKVDDFCIQYAQYINELEMLQAPEAANTRNRASRLCESEVITIMIGFHLGATAPSNSITSRL
ncbi:MAG: hypothetical protein U5K69_10155 [Balneolaceae bacterium]|nr:hypothetical protein [Balneolaceae bacterium]